MKSKVHVHIHAWVDFWLDWLNNCYCYGGGKRGGGVTIYGGDGVGMVEEIGR